MLLGKGSSFVCSVLSQSGRPSQSTLERRVRKLASGGAGHLQTFSLCRLHRNVCKQIIGLVKRDGHAHRMRLHDPHVTSVTRIFVILLDPGRSTLLPASAGIHKLLNLSAG